jgi:purine-binding chemotaxis protein CheW
MSEEQSRLISRVANLEGDKRLVMLIDPTHLLQGPEIQAVGQIGTAVSPGMPAPGLVARAA